MRYIAITIDNNWISEEGAFVPALENAGLFSASDQEEIINKYSLADKAYKIVQFDKIGINSYMIVDGV